MWQKRKAFKITRIRKSFLPFFTPALDSPAPFVRWANAEKEKFNWEDKCEYFSSQVLPRKNQKGLEKLEKYNSEETETSFIEPSERVRDHVRKLKTVQLGLELDGN